MKKEFIVVGFIILALMATNPSTEDHRQKVIDAAKENMEVAIQKTFGDAAYNKNGLEKVKPYIKNTIESIITRKNYLIFSLTELNVFGQEKNIGIGIIGNVILFEKKIEIPNSDLSVLKSNEIKNSTVASNSKEISEVRIGNQIWMSANLDVDKFRNGDPIQEAKSTEEWNRAGENHQPAWCYFNNQPNNGALFGKLYNWYAVSDSRGLSPTGWHIPNNTDWTQLIDYLDGDDINLAGIKMKSTSGWNQNSNGTNESGFNGLPSGCRINSGEFIGMGSICEWWTTKHDNSGYAWFLNIDDLSEPMRNRSSTVMVNGLSVRCLKD